MSVPVTVFFYIDALNPETIFRMPFLNSCLNDDNNCSKRLENVFGYSFSIQSSMITGKNPDATNNWMPFCYYPENASPIFRVLHNLGNYSFIDRLPLLRYGILRGLRKFLIKKGVHVNNIPLSIIHNFYFPPFYNMVEMPSFFELTRLLSKSGVSLKYVGPPYFSGDAIYDKLESILNTHEFSGSTLIFGYEDRLDYIAHKFGPSSEQYLKSAKYVDAKIKHFCQTAKTKFSDIKFIFFSDHSQADLIGSYDLILNLKRVGLEFNKDYICFIDATLAMIWPANDVAKRKIVSFLKLVKMATVIADELKEKYHLQFGRKDLYGDIILVLKPGWSFFPNFYSPFEPMKGLHGYLPDEGVQDAFIIGDKQLCSDVNNVKDIRRLFLKTCRG